MVVFVVGYYDEIYLDWEVPMQIFQQYFFAFG